VGAVRDQHLVRDIRSALASPQRVAKALGLKVHEDAGSYVLVLCPMHAERTASCSLHKREGTLGVKCWGCKWTGDVLTLVAAVEGTTTFPETLARAAELAGMQDAAEAIRGGKPAPSRAPRPVLVPEPDRDYPLPAEVSRFWAACQPVTEDAQVSLLLESRGINPERVASQDLARALHQDTHHSDVPSWARFRGRAPTSQPWTRTGHRLILPTYDSDGGVRSVRAWLVTGESGKPKRVPPAGHRASGLVVANRQAVEMLRGDGRPSRVVIVEGEPDFLARSVLSPGDAVLGVMSGSWSDAFAARVPYGSEVIIRTHLDDAGERYAGEVFESVCERAVVSRLAPTVDA
jgi:DNA primase